METLKRIRFDGTVTFGNVLTMLGMMATILMLWRNMESRIVLAEERISNLDKSINRVADNLEKLTYYTYQNDKGHQIYQNERMKQ